MSPKLNQKEWQQVAALVQQAIETGRVTPTETQQAIAQKFIQAVQEESKPRKKPPKDRWWLNP